MNLLDNRWHETLFFSLAQASPLLCTLFRGFESDSTLSKYRSVSGWEQNSCGRNKCFSERQIVTTLSPVFH